MQKRSLCLALSLLLLIVGQLNAQRKSEKSVDIKKFSVSCIAFYNLENLYDTINDPTINDEDFLPHGANKWGTLKYTNKQKNMAYAISQIGTEVVPHGVALLGVCEIENRFVLEELVAQPAIADRNYQIIHFDSPDRRGIDVGLLYNPTYFTPTHSRAIPILMEDSTFRTRDQLLVSGYLQGEKIHIIVNHWPSRYGGEERSRPKRSAAANVTLSICDSIYAHDAKAKIVIMGDMNDDPINNSCANVLQAKKDRNEVSSKELFNTLWETFDRGEGSLYYNGKWNLFDQIIISGNLANAKKNKLSYWKSEIVNAPFLTAQEGRQKGGPLRTHSGGVWLNGYSDHYPIMMYLTQKK